MVKYYFDIFALPKGLQGSTGGLQGTTVNDIKQNIMMRKTISFWEQMTERMAGG